VSSIYLNGEYWYYQYSVNINGRMKRRQISLKTKDERTARKRQQIYDRKYEDLKNPFLDTRELLTKAVDDYITFREKQVARRVLSPRTLASDRGALYMFRDYIKSQNGDLYLSDIRKRDIENFKEHRLDKDKVSITTLGVNLRHLKSFFSYQRKQEKIPANPMDDITIDAGERREIVPLDDDWKKLYEHLSGFLL
jgi:hypothetical protein